VFIMEAIEKPATDLMTVAEAAKLANVAPVTVYRRIHEGQIEAIRVGDGRGPIRVPREPFVRWLYGDSQ
jgi:excisionase family DNA binding protein